MQGEKRCCVLDSEAARRLGQSRPPRGPPTWRGPMGTVGAEVVAASLPPAPGLVRLSPSPPARDVPKAAERGFERKTGPNWEKQTSR